jgi:hypothetical protein
MRRGSHDISHLTMERACVIQIEQMQFNSREAHIAALRDVDLAIAWYLVPVNDLEWDPLYGIGRKLHPSMAIVSLNL